METDPPVNGQVPSGIPGLASATVPDLLEIDDEAEIHQEVQSVFEDVDDPVALKNFRERVEKAAKKARHAGHIRQGKHCQVREVDPDIWGKNNDPGDLPEIGTIYHSFRSAGVALGVGYNTISVRQQRHPDNSLLTVNGITLEILND